MKKRVVIAAAAAVLSLTGSGICSAAGAGIAGTQQSQFAAERWGKNSTQMSVYFPEEEAPGEVGALRYAVDEALKTASLSPTEHTRLWYDAYSTVGGVAQAAGTRPNGGRGRMIAVGGDFFLLHTLAFLDGSGLTDADLMKDRVVLDETLSWELFGSSQSAGMPLTVEGIPCVVAGVVKNPENPAEKAAYPEYPVMYLSYSLMEQLTGETVKISCYEAVLPNPVRGFGKRTIEECIGMKDAEIIENTGRYSIGHSWDTLLHLHDMVIHRTALAYPWWENAARRIAFDKAVLLLMSILFLLYPVGYGLYWIRRGYRKVNGILTEKMKKRHRHIVTEDSIQS